MKYESITPWIPIEFAESRAGYEGHMESRVDLSVSRPFGEEELKRYVELLRARGQTDVADAVELKAEREGLSQPAVLLPKPE